MNYKDGLCFLYFCISERSLNEMNECRTMILFDDIMIKAFTLLDTTQFALGTFNKRVPCPFSSYSNMSLVLQIVPFSGELGLFGEPDPS